MNKQVTLIAQLQQLKLEFAWVLVFGFIANLMMLAPTLYMLQLYDRVMLSRSELTLITVSAITLLFFIVMGFAEWCRSSILIRAGVALDQAIHQKVFKLIFRQAQRNQAHKQIGYLTTLRQFLTGSGMVAMLDAPWSLLYLAVLFILSPWLGWVALAFCGIQMCLALWSQTSTQEAAQLLAAHQHDEQHFLQSRLKHIETLHIMGMLPKLYQQWLSLQSDDVQKSSRLTHLQTRNQTMSKFARYSMQSLVLGLGAILAIQGKISVGSMIAANVLMTRTLQPFDVIVGTWGQYMQAKHAFKQLNALMATEKLPHSTSQSLQLNKGQATQGKILLNRLNVNLANNKHVLKNITAALHNGAITTIMGASGSGKTTLVRCLIGVCPAAQQGAQHSVLIDGVAISEFCDEQLAATFGYLPQDVELIEGTIAENIARFQDVDSNKVIEAATLAGIHEMVLKMPNGYDTNIEENGLILSGGQRQRIAFARAIYGMPSIIVLDEPNANLDEQGEAQLLEAIVKLKNQGKTIVVISHRTNILKVTDQLMVLNEGELTHFGDKLTVLAALQKNQQQSQHLSHSEAL